MPAVSFAQTTGGERGPAGSAGGVANSPASAAWHQQSRYRPIVRYESRARGYHRRRLTIAGTADAAVNAENQLLDKKLKSICRGC